MWFDRFDICEAYYCYMALWPGGGGSKEFALTSVFSRLQFRPRDSVTHNPEALTENGRVIYDMLVNGQTSIRDRR